MKFLKRQLYNFSNRLYRIHVILLCVHTRAPFLANALSNSILSRRYKGVGIIQSNFSCHLGRQGWEEKAPKDVLTRDL